MFDIGFAELIVIAIVGLLVIGPDQLPGTIRTASLWLGRLRQGFQSIKADVEREIGADDIRQQLHNESVLKSLNASKQELKNLQTDLNNTIAPPSQKTEKHE